MDRLEGCWYSMTLEAMREPRLFGTTDPGHEEYRFLWLRSFDAPIAVRVVRNPDGGTLTAVALRGPSDVNPGRVIFAGEAPLTNAQWNELRAAVDRAAFWTCRAHDGREGLDGAQWVLEGVRDGRHHVVRRWSPEPRGPDRQLRRACLHLLGLADLGPLASRVY